METTITNDDRIAMAEVDYVLRHMNERYFNKIPQNVKDFITVMKKSNKQIYVDHEIPLESQGLKEFTLYFLMILNLKYWCNDERKKDILAMLERNQKKYEDKVNDIFNQADNISGDESSLSEYNSNSRPKEVVVTGSPRSSSQATATMEPQNKIEHQTTNASENAFEKLKEETSIIEKEEINIFKKIVSKIKSIFVKSKQ